MKRTIQGIILSASLLTGGFALAQSGATGGTQPGMGQGQGKAMGQTMGQGKAMKGMGEFQGFMAPTDEKALLERLHYANQQEIKLGQLAQKNAQSPEVKAFADMMVKDHTAMDQKLMSYAQGKGMKLGDMPKAMNDMEKKMMAQDKATMEELQVLTGAAFDSCYMAGQVGDHDATLGRVMAAKQAMPAPAGEMASMMQELMQKVPAHREQAWNILGKLDDSMGVGGAGMGGNNMNGNNMGGTMDHGKMNHGGTGMGGTTGGNMGGGASGTTPPSPKK
jgi:putative membrane protein